jgi:4-hydroxy-tetrahydrodipicolinate synthase
MILRSERQRLVERVVARVRSRALVYAGIGDLRADDAAAGNGYLDAGADAVVARAPVSMAAADLPSWFQVLLDQLNGPVILYNIPLLTRVSIPLQVVERLADHPRLVGLKDSENDPQRLETLMHRLGSRPGFSVFVGVGRLMETGLRLGAEGIVPSVGNLIPETCHLLWTCARRGDWSGAKQHADRMNAVATLYQADRDLGESLAALKGALSLLGVCEPHMSPPLQPLNPTELQSLALELNRLHLTAPAKSVAEQNAAIHHTLS